jgi:protein-S-isoprenylcysteine O-methyltransferase Ste14
VIDNSPNEKSLHTTSFVVHVTRGVIRDQRVRRKTMLVLLVGAVALLLCGLTFLQPALSPHEHPMRVLIFWIACIWLTLAALLLAIFDLLTVRMEARRAERALREGLDTGTTTPKE